MVRGPLLVRNQYAVSIGTLDLLIYTMSALVWRRNYFKYFSIVLTTCLPCRLEPPGLK